MSSNCHICNKPLKKGDKVYTTLEGKVTKKGEYVTDDNDPLTVCEVCGRELEGAVETLKRYNDDVKKKEGEEK